MTVLAELGLATSQESKLLLIAPPDAVLAEAGRMKPRPLIASTLSVARPTPQVAWWSERRLLDPATLSRFNWMLQVAQGKGWIVVDPDEEGITGEELREAVGRSALRPGEERQLSNGEIALEVLPT